MNERTQPTQIVEDKLTSIRKRLEDSFTQLNIILDVGITCHKTLDFQNVEQDESVANVLQRCGSDKPDEQLEALTEYRGGAWWPHFLQRRPRGRAGRRSNRRCGCESRRNGGRPR